VRLFFDLDQTLVWSFRLTRSERERPTNVTPDARIKFGQDSFDLYFRPDLYLIDRPFSVISSGSAPYVQAIADVLFKKGMMVEEAFDISFLAESDEEKPPITKKEAVLIDDLGPNQMGTAMKLRVLPQAKLCRVDAWTETTLPKISERRPNESLHEWMARPRKVALEFSRQEGSKSLKECLDRR